MAAVTLSFVEQQRFAVLRMVRGENRINPEFVRAFNDCLNKVESTPSCKGIVTTGDGKFFCNGLDLEWIGRKENAEQVMPFFTSFQDLLVRILTFPVPTVAAINGHCYAGGALIALAHDFRVMNAHRGWFCMNEVLINLRLSPFIVAFLKRKIKSGPTHHRVLVLGQKFTGPEAVENELVDKAVSPPLVEQEGLRLLAAWVGKEGYLRESMQNMKLDVYSDVLKLLHTPRL